MTRSEHMRWAKSRASEYVDNGDPAEALASMMSDLGKHDETRDMVSFCVLVGTMHTSSPAAMRHFIGGFAE